jgi:hypothetical protein
MKHVLKKQANEVSKGGWANTFKMSNSKTGLENIKYVHQQATALS